MFGFKDIRKEEWLIVAILLSFFITDSLNVLILKYRNTEELLWAIKYVKLSTCSKSVFLFLYIIYLIKKHIRLVVGMSFIFLLFFNIAIASYGSINGIFILTWLKHFFMLILPFILFYLLDKVKYKHTSIVNMILVIIVVIQVFIVYYSSIYNVRLFSTYGTSRFGYSGLLFGRNDATFFYVLASVFIFKYWENAKNNFVLILLIGVILSSILLGTKAVFIFIGSFFIFLGFYYRLYRKSYFWIGGVIIIVISSFLLYKLGLVEYYVSQANEKGWLYMITSKRNVLIEERLPAVFEKWHWYNYLFGGVNPATSFVEMDMIDLFLFGGIVGSLLYYFLLLKTIFSFSKYNYLGWFLVSQYFLIGGLAGHVFASGINAIYLVITSYYLQMSDGKSVE